MAITSVPRVTRVLTRVSTCALLVLAATGAVSHAQGGGAPPNPPAKPDSAAKPFTVDTAQARRGAAVYLQLCAACHEALEYQTQEFRDKWNNRPAFDLYDLMRTTMPDDAPGTLTAQQYADVIAYMFKLNGVPAGDTVLPTDDAAMKQIKVAIPNAKGAPTEPMLLLRLVSRPSSAKSRPGLSW